MKGTLEYDLAEPEEAARFEAAKNGFRYRNAMLELINWLSAETAPLTREDTLATIRVIGARHMLTDVSLWATKHISRKPA